MSFSAIQVGLLALSLGSAVVYFGWFLHRAPSAARSFFKTVPVAALAALVPSFGGPVLLLLALGLSALGDLALSRNGEGAFRLGLGAFLLGHIAYVALFWQGAGAVAVWQGAAIGLVVVLALGSLSLLWRGLGALRWPVVAYICIITAMAGAAILRGSPWPLLAGAALFMASDLVLGLETFRLPATARRWSAPVIWVTYYGAQVLIAAAFLCPYFTG